MSLYTQTLGQGPELVLVHGWGLSACIWQQLAEKLADRYRVTLLDLPGHGQSPLLADMSADSIVDAMLAAAPTNATWAGWSLGGMLSLAAAARGEVAALVMLASSPRFVAASDWQQAMQPDVMQQFCDDLERDYRRTLNRFLLLQTRDSEAAGKSLCALKTCLAEHPPQQAGLDAGLGLLGTLDLRDAFAQLPVPCELVMGGRDTLVPAGVAADMQALNRNIGVTMIDSAGHAPMLSHEQETMAAIDKAAYG